MNDEGELGRLEAVLDDAEVCASIEGRLPTGGRPRQLPVRTLLLGMMLALSDHRPAHLTRVHRALVQLPELDRRRLCVVVAWKSGPHLLTYRQVERTFALVVNALQRDEPNGTPSEILAQVTDALAEASVPNAGRTPAHRWRSTGATWTASPGVRSKAAGERPTPKLRGDVATATARAARTNRSLATSSRRPPW